jgi:hypothetical protein
MSNRISAHNKTSSSSSGGGIFSKLFNRSSKNQSLNSSAIVSPNNYEQPNSAASFRETDELNYTSISPKPSSLHNTSNLSIPSPQQSSPSHESRPEIQKNVLISQLPSNNHQSTVIVQQQQQQPQRRSTPPTLITPQNLTPTHNSSTNNDPLITPQLTLTHLHAQQLQLQQEKGHHRHQSKNNHLTTSSNTNAQKTQKQLALHTSHEIEEKLHSEYHANRQQNIIRLLLLGSGESGKSTILKQMKILHCNGYSDNERIQMKSLIFNNTLSSIQQLLSAVERFGYNYTNPKNQQYAQKIQELYELTTITSEFVQQIQSLWCDSSIKCAFQRGSEYNLLDSASYFLTNIHRFSDAQYKPTNADILRTRQATRGIIETDFIIDKIKFRMFDVGGQRGERKKWIHCFDDNVLLNINDFICILSLSE